MSTRQIQSNGISCFSGPEMITDEGLKELSGMGEDEFKHHIGESSGAGANAHTHHGGASAAGADMSGKKINWQKLELPICVYFQASTLGAQNATSFTCTHLRDFLSTLVTAETSNETNHILPENTSLRSIVGAIFVKDLLNTSYMDIIGALSVEPIKNDIAFPIVATSGSKMRGNMLFAANEKVLKNKVIPIRKQMEPVIQASFLANFGNKYSISDLMNVPKQSSGTKFIVPSDSPMVAFIDKNLILKAMKETNYAPGTPDKKGEFASQLRNLRLSHFGTESDPKRATDDVMIPVSTYTRALNYVKNDDESKLTLKNLLQEAKITFFRAHKNADPFSADNDNELMNRGEPTDRNYRRINCLKFTLVVLLGALPSDNKR